jgi:septal ring factor EnvC (AmiA/AmiB activator)
VNSGKYQNFKKIPKILTFLFFAFLFSGFIFSEIIGSEAKKPEEIKIQLEQERRELKSLQKKINDKKNQIQETKKKEKRVISELNRIEKELFRRQRELKQYEKNFKKKKKEIKAISNEIEKLTSEIKNKENHLANQIKALYKLSRKGMLDTLFSSGSFPELIRQYDYMNRIIDYNLVNITDYSKKLEMIQKRKQELEDSEKKLVELTEKTRLVQKKILHHQKEKTILLAKIKSEKELHLKALEELKQASRHLQALIDRLEKGTPTDVSQSPDFLKKDFYSLKGKLSFPVEGEVITYFGKHEDPEFSTVSFNKGIEIASRIGSPIKAVLDGTVIYSDWFKGYGNIIIIDHGDGYYTLFGHVSELFKKVGDQVNAEEIIGLVGDTGSLKGANLYFEIRHHGKPLDPLDWLKPNNLNHSKKGK